jgi:hypothetical protein
VLHLALMLLGSTDIGLYCHWLLDIGLLHPRLLHLRLLRLVLTQLRLLRGLRLRLALRLQIGLPGLLWFRLASAMLGVLRFFRWLRLGQQHLRPFWLTSLKLTLGHHGLLQVDVLRLGRLGLALLPLVLRQFAMVPLRERSLTC